VQANVDLRPAALAAPGHAHRGDDVVGVSDDLLHVGLPAAAPSGGPSASRWWSWYSCALLVVMRNRTPHLPGGSAGRGCLALGLGLAFAAMAVMGCGSGQSERGRVTLTVAGG